VVLAFRQVPAVIGQHDHQPVFFGMGFLTALEGQEYLPDLGIYGLNRLLILGCEAESVAGDIGFVEVGEQQIGLAVFQFMTDVVDDARINPRALEGQVDVALGNILGEVFVDHVPAHDAGRLAVREGQLELFEQAGRLIAQGLVIGVDLMAVNPTAGKDGCPARATDRGLLGGGTQYPAGVTFVQVQAGSGGSLALLNGLLQLFVLHAIHADEQGLVGFEGVGSRGCQCRECEAQTDRNQGTP